MAYHASQHSTLIDALLGAGGYHGQQQDAPAAQDEAPARAALQAEAEEDLRTAQVELYCDHDARALVAIRHAMRLLEASHDAALEAELPALGAAAWHVRQHDTLAAAEMLERSRERLHG